MNLFLKHSLKRVSLSERGRVLALGFGAFLQLSYSRLVRKDRSGVRELESL